MLPPGGHRPIRSGSNRDPKSNISFKSVLKHLAVSFAMFSAMLLVIHILEEPIKAAMGAELQKQRAAKTSICIKSGLNRTEWELDNCIEVSLMLSALLEAGVPPEETVAALSQKTGLSAGEIGKIVTALGSPSYATEVSQRSAAQTSQRPHSATEISRWSATQISQIRHRVAEASQRSAVGQQVALCESRGEHYRYREGACQLRVWVCTESQTSTGYEKECKYEWRNA